MVCRCRGSLSCSAGCACSAAPKVAGDFRDFRADRYYNWVDEGGYSRSMRAVGQGALPWVPGFVSGFILDRVVASARKSFRERCAKVRGHARLHRMSRPRRIAGFLYVQRPRRRKSRQASELASSIRQINVNYY